MSTRSHPPSPRRRPPGFDLENFLPYRLSVLTNTVSRALAREYVDRFGVGVLEWRVIAVLGRFEPLSAKQVCQRTAMDKVAVSRAVRALREKGLISRREDPGDRRRGLLRLSARGRGVHDRIAVRATRLERRLCQPLTGAELRQLRSLLGKLGEHAARLDAGGRADG